MVDISAAAKTIATPHWLQKLWRDDPAMTATAFVMLACVPLFLGLGFVDDHAFNGANIWTKPTKFAVSIAIFTGTIAFFARFMSVEQRNSSVYRAWMALAGICAIAEMVWIGGAAWAGVASHFNSEGGFMTVIYPLMGMLAAILTIAAGIQAFMIARNQHTGLAPVVRSSLVIGLGLTLPLTLITAFTMAGMADGHGVGLGTSTGGNSRTLLFGWLRDAGDLRVPHFFATHAMHALPAIGIILVWLGRPDMRSAIWAAAIAYTAFVGFTFAQALQGQPFLPMIG